MNNKSVQHNLDAELDQVSLLRDNLRQQWAPLEESISALEARKQELNLQNGEHKRKDKVKFNVGGQSIWAKRSTLSIFPSKLAALLSGRWDRRLLRDSKQRIFLDVNPVCFRKIVEAHVLQLIASPGQRPVRPVVPEELDETLTRLIDFFGLDSFFEEAVEREPADVSGCSDGPLCEETNETSIVLCVGKGGCKLELPARSVCEVVKATCYMEDQRTVDVAALIQTFVDAGEGSLSLMVDSTTLGVTGEVTELALSYRPFDVFDINKLSAALQKEQIALMRSRAVHQADIKMFEEEKEWVQYFLASEPAPEAPEVVELNVSGERVCTKRSTIMLCSESALARQFDATVWAQGGSTADRDSDDSDDEDVFIESNAYCFQLIIDQLRLIAIAGPQDGKPSQPLPPEPQVIKHEKANFEKLLHFYFPGVESFIKTTGRPMAGTAMPDQSTILDSNMWQYRPASWQ